MALSSVNGPLALFAAPASALGWQFVGVLKEHAGESTTSRLVACAGPGRVLGVLGDKCLPMRLLGDSGSPAEPCLAKVKDMRVPPSPSAPDPPFAKDVEGGATAPPPSADAPHNWLSVSAGGDAK